MLAIYNHLSVNRSNASYSQSSSSKQKSGANHCLLIACLNDFVIVCHTTHFPIWLSNKFGQKINICPLSRRVRTQNRTTPLYVFSFSGLSSFSQHWCNRCNKYMWLRYFTLPSSQRWCNPPQHLCEQRSVYKRANVSYAGEGSAWYSRPESLVWN